MASAEIVKSLLPSHCEGSRDPTIENQITGTHNADELVGANVALTALLSFALLSVLWSDFPLIALKRWFRDLGLYLVILIVLSDPRPFEAIRLLLRRVCFVLVSLSILLNKYFPEMSVYYNEWTGQGYFGGAAGNKNLLGLLLLVSGLFFFWDTLMRWGDRKKRRTRWIIAVNLAFLAMTLWLLSATDCATAKTCWCRFLGNRGDLQQTV